MTKAERAAFNEYAAKILRRAFKAPGRGAARFRDQRGRLYERDAKGTIRRVKERSP
jgi:hypothetical protein